MIVIAGASRMSSVCGLNARPQTAKSLPLRFPLKCLSILLNSTFFWRSLALSTAWMIDSLAPAPSAVRISARTSLGKHEPPYPTPGNRNGKPIRESDPTPLRTSLTSAPTASQRLATSFMNEILVASSALEAYLVISALRTPMTRIGFSVRTNGA